MKSVLIIETSKPIGVRDLNCFLAAIVEHMPGAFVSQGPAVRGRLTVYVFCAVPLALEVAEEALESTPHLCDSITGLYLREPVRRAG